MNDRQPTDPSAALAPGSFGLRAFLTTQFLGAFNDNAFRFTLIFYVLAAVQGEDAQGRWLGANQALFAVPFIIFAALAGSLADRWSKTHIIRGAKLLEVLVMLAGLAAFAADSLGGLTAVLFVMATQSAFFGPGKYGLLAETLHEGELVRANALVQLTTMLAIVGGQIMGGVLYDAYQDNLSGAAVWFVGFALVGTLASLGVPKVQPARPHAPPVWNPFPELLATWRGVRSDRTLLYTMLGNAHFWLMMAALQINLAAYGQDGLGMQQRAGAAALVATASLGLGAGSMLASRWSEGRVELGLVPLGALAMTVGLVLVALVQPVPLSWLPESWASPELAVAEPGLADVIWLKLQVAAQGLIGRGLWAPFGAVALLGLAGGLYLVPIMSLLQVFAPANEKGRYLAFSNMVGFVGIALSAGLLYLPRALGCSFAEQFLLLAAISLLGAVVCLRLLPYAFVRLLAWLLAHTLYRLRTLHSERLPETGGALLLVNHVSWVDALVLGASTERKVHFLMYRAYYEWWPTRWLFRLVGCIPVATGDKPEVTAASLRAAGELLSEGRVVAVFGEGSVTRLGHLLPFRTGYQRLIEGRDVPIVPVYLGGLWGSVLSHRGGRFLRRLPRISARPVTVAFGQPLPSDTSPGQARAAIQAVAAEAWAARRRAPLQVSFARTARRAFARSLVDDGGARASAAELWARAGVLARSLRARTEPGARVAMSAAPSLGSAASVLALLRSQCVPVLVDPGLDAPARADAARAAGATAWLLEPGQSEGPPGLDVVACPAAGAGLLLARLGGALRGLLPNRRGAGLAARGGGESAAGVDADIAAVVFERDGSPRDLTHTQLASEVSGLREVLDLDREDVVLSVLPWSSAYGLSTGLWLPLLGLAGAAWSRDPEPRALGRFVERSEASVGFTSPRRLAHWQRELRPDGLGGLRQLYVAGDGYDSELAAAFAERFGLEPSLAWSPDGCAGLVALNIPDVRSPGVYQRGTRAGTVGHPLPGVHVMALRDDGSVCPPGTSGVLRIDGPAVASGSGEPGPCCGRGSVDDDGFVTLEAVGD